MRQTKLFILLLYLLLESTAAFDRPNIVFVLTDDQDVVLKGLDPMEQTKKLIAENGATFTNAFATTPICCPSRSSILTGLYLHSHGVVNNSLSGGCSSRQWQKRQEPNTFGPILQRSGYKTFYAGKYLNQYGHESAGGPEHVPPGWDWWVGLAGNSVYYNYTLSVNGTPVFRGNNESDYLTDVLSEYSLEFLKMTKDPFLMVINPPSPHEPFTPANRHKGMFSKLKAPRTPSFNLPVNDTKHWLLRLPPNILPKKTINKIDEAFRNRWESLLSADDLIKAIILKLRDLKKLDKTFVMFSSDHGFHLGQFGLPWDKRQPYETDIRIPLLLRGPGVPRKSINDPVLNIDFAATILDMAGLGSRNFGDGHSFLPLINSVPEGRTSRTFLIEYRGEMQKAKGSSDCYLDPNVKICKSELSCKCFDAKNNTFSCLRRISGSMNDVYCEFEDSELFKEYYDLRKDPHQIYNAARTIETSLHKRILDCCRKNILSRTKVDECFKLL